MCFRKVALSSARHHSLMRTAGANAEAATEPEVESEWHRESPGENGRSSNEQRFSSFRVLSEVRVLPTHLWPIKEQTPNTTDINYRQQQQHNYNVSDDNRTRTLHAGTQKQNRTTEGQQQQLEYTTEGVKTRRMSLETTVVSNVSLNSSNNSSQGSSSDNSCKKEDNTNSSDTHLEHHQPENHFATSTHRVHNEEATPSDQQQQREQHQLPDSSRPISSCDSSNSNTNKKHQRHHRRRSQATKSSAGTASSPPPCHWLVEQIIHTVGELEHTLIEDHQNDFELRMALERQTERVQDLRSSLATEKQRNERLVELIRGVDSYSSMDEDEQHLTGGGASYINGSPWQSRSSMDAFESISPLLMQQRYDELALSHRQCRKQLIKKEKLLTHTKCEKEEAQGHYDHLLDEYRSVQKRLEELCCKYLRLQAKKNQEILKLREALSYASDCVISAQQVMEDHNSDESCSKEFRQNLQLFIKALRLCEWVQHSSSRPYEKH